MKTAWPFEMKVTVNGGWFRSQVLETDSSIVGRISPIFGNFQARVGTSLSSILPLFGSSRPTKLLF
ncbi:MAG TPA: hypothetical protein VGQ39_14610 [Pyrinomonadaceae bacterium]|nr:hypothetical protein [Pyrinomonadaceae bacterium]